MPSADFERLPADPSPVHYDLTYTWVSLSTSTEFEGIVDVSLEFGNAHAGAASTVLRLNSVNLQIVSAKLKEAGRQQQPREAERIALWPAKQEVELAFEGPTPAGKASLIIEFRGRLNDQLAGFYKSKLSETELMGVTQFEATDARRAFPCWDEPARKATFKLSMNVPKDALVLSNTRVRSKTLKTSSWPSGEKREGVTWEFNPTPKMSTYLLAWVVAPSHSSLDALSMHSTKAPYVETIVYVPKGKVAQAEFACKVGVLALDFFEELFDLKYCLPLMQHIACPDFAAGAMENWGCITYREARLLVDEKTTTSTARRDVARVVAHELSHQFFGNSTTMEWWSDLFLNEGFARLCEFLAVDHIFPELDCWTTFDLEVVGTAMRLDALKSSHAIRVEVGHPDEINEIFDAVSYAKGATLLRMLMNFLGGQDVFIRGVRAYLKEFQYKNAEADDLWRHLERGANMPEGYIVNLMRAWTTQIGYPVISVNSEGGKIKLDQERYLAVSAPGDDTRSVKWTVPATVLFADGESEFFAVTPGTTGEKRLQELEERLSKIEQNNAWFVLNGKNDLFRVRYTDQQFKRIAREGIAQGKISPRARLSVVRDAFDLAESGHLPVNVALEVGLQVLDVSSQERDPVVLLQLVSKLNALVLLYSSESFSLNFNQMCLASLGNLVRGLGPWKNLDGFFAKEADPAKIDELRVAVLRLAVDCSNESKVAEEAFARLQKHVSGEEACANDLRPAIFRMAASYDGKRTLDLLLGRYDSIESQEKRETFSSFAGLRKDEDIRRAVAFTKSSKVRAQDVPMCVAALSATKLGARLLWEDFRTDFAWWMSRFSDGNFLWSGIVGNMTSGLPTLEEALQVVKFFEEHPNRLGSAKRALDQAVERVRAKEGQLNRDRPIVQKFIDGLKV